MQMIQKALSTLLLTALLLGGPKSFAQWFPDFIPSLPPPVGNRLEILALDFETPFEVNVWLSVLELKSENCPLGYQHCNDEFVVRRPFLLADDEFYGSNNFIHWISENEISADVLLFSGHHSGGFTGNNGTLYFWEFVPLLDIESSHRFFTRPVFAYFGGCFTVDNRFSDIETDPVAYINRVLSHENEIPRLDLLRGALHQLASGDRNPWARVFPNSAEVGFDESGPGEKSEPYSKHLIETFGKELKRQTGSKSASKALFSILSEAIRTGNTGMNSDLLNLTDWWATSGRRQSGTNASSYMPDFAQHVNKPVMTKFAETQRLVDSYAVLKDFLTVLVMNDAETNPWITKFSTAERMQLISDTASVIGSIPMTPEQRDEAGLLAFLLFSEESLQTDLIALTALRDIRPVSSMIQLRVLESLKSSEKSIRDMALSALWMIGPKNLSVLQKMTQDFPQYEPETKDIILRIFRESQTKDPETHLMLAQVLRTEISATEKIQVLKCLGELNANSKVVLKIVVPFLAANDVQVRSVALSLFLNNEAFHIQRVSQEVSQLLRLEPIYIVRTSLQILRRIGIVDRVVAPRIRDLLKRDSLTVAELALTTVYSLGMDDFGTLLRVQSWALRKNELARKILAEFAPDWPRNRKDFLLKKLETSFGQDRWRR